MTKIEESECDGMVERHRGQEDGEVFPGEAWFPTGRAKGGSTSSVLSRNSWGFVDPSTPSLSDGLQRGYRCDVIASARGSGGRISIGFARIVSVYGSSIIVVLVREMFVLSSTRSSSGFSPSLSHAVILIVILDDTDC